MNRRDAVLALAALGAVPLASEGQQKTKISRIGFLSPGSPPDSRMQHVLEAFRRGMGELGYVEGQNITIESRWAEGKYDRLPGLAAELVLLKVDVIVASAVPAIRAAKEATSTIPIVMAIVVDPVVTGLVASFARPGGNITGLSNMAPELVGKQLEMLKEVVPTASRVAVLWNPANPGNVPQMRAAEVAARTMGVRLQPVEVRNPGELDSAFAAMTKQRAGALIVLADSMFSEHRTRIADLAAKSRLASVYGLPEFAEAGGLMAYSANRSDLFRRAAIYVDKILRGAKPADLPVERPNKFEMVINLKTAKALGVKIPQSLLIRADEVIE
jgi:putative ABC transport system substrate-binding protein